MIVENPSGRGWMVKTRAFVAAVAVLASVATAGRFQYVQGRQRAASETSFEGIDPRSLDEALGPVEVSGPTEAPAADDPLAGRAPAEVARESIATALDRYQTIRDYSCTFLKREVIAGRLTEPHIMAMKVRTQPESIYFKFVQPNRGREAIFESARHDGKILAHDVGLARMLAGTMVLDPLGSMAMEGNRHPVNEAGIGALIRTVKACWDRELDTPGTVVEVHPQTHAVGRTCRMIEVTHPDRRPEFRFHRVRLFLDQERGLPIRFEAYEWPETSGAEPMLVEEYCYRDLSIDVGLNDIDFDPANPRYAFRRF